MNERAGWGLPSILTIIFLVLKLTGLISWPWIWVFAPLWIWGGLILTLLILFGIGAGLFWLFSRRR